MTCLGTASSLPSLFVVKGRGNGWWEDIYICIYTHKHIYMCVFVYGTSVGGGKWEVAKGQRLCMPHVPSESYTIWPNHLF